MCLCIFLSVSVGTNIKDFQSLQVFTNILQLNFIFWSENLVLTGSLQLVESLNPVWHSKLNISFLLQKFIRSFEDPESCLHIFQSNRWWSKPNMQKNSYQNQKKFGGKKGKKKIVNIPENVWGMGRRCSRGLKYYESF